MLFIEPDLAEYQRNNNDLAMQDNPGYIISYRYLRCHFNVPASLTADYIAKYIYIHPPQ